MIEVENHPRAYLIVAGKSGVNGAANWQADPSKTR